MKLKLITVGLMVIMALSLLACSPEAAEEPVSPAPNKVSVAVTCDDFMKVNHISQEVEISADGTLTVTLCSNPTTGFLWSESAQISDTTVLQQTDHQLIVPGPEPPPPPGTPSQEVWTLKALKKGTSTVSMEYSRPWEGGEKGAWTFVLTVTVK